MTTPTDKPLWHHPAPDAAAPNVPSPSWTMTIPAAPVGDDAELVRDVLACIDQIARDLHNNDVVRLTLERAAARIAELERDAANLTRRLEIEKRRHALGMSMVKPMDPAETLATLGFWPDCKCYECWSNECLRVALDERDAALRQLAAAQTCIVAADAMARYFTPPRSPELVMLVNRYDAARAAIAKGTP